MLDHKVALQWLHHAGAGWHRPEIQTACLVELSSRACCSMAPNMRHQGPQPAAPYCCFVHQAAKVRLPVGACAGRRLLKNDEDGTGVQVMNGMTGSVLLATQGLMLCYSSRELCSMASRCQLRDALVRGRCGDLYVLSLPAYPGATSPDRSTMFPL